MPQMTMNNLEAQQSTWGDDDNVDENDDNNWAEADDDNDYATATADAAAAAADDDDDDDDDDDESLASQIGTKNRKTWSNSRVHKHVLGPSSKEEKNKSFSTSDLNIFLAFTASVARAATATEVLEEWSLESITDAKAEPSIQLSSLYLHILI